MFTGADFPFAVWLGEDGLESLRIDPVDTVGPNDLDPARTRIRVERCDGHVDALSGFKPHGQLGFVLVGVVRVGCAAAPPNILPTHTRRLP